MDDAGTEGIEELAAELLALAPEHFTEARNAAAKRLKDEGDRTRAEAVKRLPRPSLALWTANRLAREQPALVEAFLEASAALREAYASGGDIRAATAPERAAEARLVAAAGEALRSAGKSPSDAVQRSLSQTLRAAAADAEIAATLRAGLVIREPDAPSIDQLLGSLPDPPPRAASAPAQSPQTAAGSKPSAPAPADDRRAERAALREGIAAARKAATEARRIEREASDAARALHDEWERAQTRAARAKRRSETADERLAELQGELDEL